MTHFAFNSTQRALVAGLCAAVLMAAPAVAQYPDRPLRYIVPQAAGSASDTSARILAHEFTRILGQQVVVDNRPGGGLTIGIEMVVRAAPDGYTIGYGNIGGLAINRSILPKVPYDALKDVQPIAQTNTGSQMLAVSNSQPIKTVRELINQAKANPGKLLNASSGNGSPGHLAGELFKQMAGVNIAHVPYKGGAQQVIALVAGESQASIATVASVVQHIRAGRLRALGLSATRRSSALPEIPTIAEAGVPGYDMSPWIAVFAPAATPRAIIDRLNTEINRALKLPDVVQNLSTQGLDPWPSSSEEFSVRLKTDFEKYERLIRMTGAKVD